MILEKIRIADKKYCLFKNVSRITVACSGGADSMALLHALCVISNEYGFTVSAAHFNHGIRGAEADRDENFVKEYCEKHGVDFVSGFGNVPEYAKQKGDSIELAARELRYKFLQEAASGGVIATAHHAGDNLETMLFNLTRGTALSGLCGIPAKRDIYIRPLLLCTREEIELYCKENSIDYVTDSTNLEDNYARNRLRHKVVPVLKEMRPSVEVAAMRTAQSLREDEDCLNALAKKEYDERFLNNSISLKNFEELPSAIAKRVIKNFFTLQTGKNADFLHITEMYACCKNSGKVSLPGNYEAVVEGGKLFIKLAEKVQDTQFKVELSEQNADLSTVNKKVHNLLLKNSIDCDKIVGKLVLRTREPSDRVYINGRGGTKTLKKLYNEYKIPLCERANLPVLADDKGIVWIGKIGVARRCAVSNKTNRYYVVSIIEI